MHAPTHTYTHAHQPAHTTPPHPPPTHTHTHTHTNTGGSRAALALANTGSPRKNIKTIITTTASQVPQLLSQSTDWANRKFYEVCGNPKWFRPFKSQYTVSQYQHVPPYIRFERVAELCSRLWLVVAVRQRDKRKGSTEWRLCGVHAICRDKSMLVATKDVFCLQASWLFTPLSNQICIIRCYYVCFGLLMQISLADYSVYLD